jgi:hypothetical protein
MNDSFFANIVAFPLLILTVFTLALIVIGILRFIELYTGQDHLQQAPLVSGDVTSPCPNIHAHDTANLAHDYVKRNFLIDSADHKEHE